VQHRAARSVTAVGCCVSQPTKEKVDIDFSAFIKQSDHREAHMAHHLNVLTICGSLRKGSYNAMVQRALPSLAPEGMTIKPAPSFAEFPLYNADVQDSSGFPGPVNILAEAIRVADGVIIVTPEYNFSIPGGLKNAIDWVSRLPNQPFAGKLIALQSASPGPLGGGRVQYDMRRAMVFLDAFTLNKPEIFIGNCTSKLDETTGEITDDTTRNLIKQQLAAFAKFIEHLSVKN
jgi:chromate reductase